MILVRAAPSFQPITFALSTDQSIMDDKLEHFDAKKWAAMLGSPFDVEDSLLTMILRP
jgi:hypothetical protein